MSRHTYPTSAMLGDYLRAAAGLIPTTTILATTRVGSVAATVLGGFAALFAVFALRTVLRNATRLELTDAALRASGLLRASIDWDELDRIRLGYYSMRRDGRGGWMQLELRSGRSILRVDSRIEGFAELVDASVKAAERRGLSFNVPTSENLQALGVKLRSEEPSMREAARGAA